MNAIDPIVPKRDDLAGLAGHIGMGILRHYRITFDYSRRQMILEPYAAGAAPSTSLASRS